MNQKMQSDESQIKSLMASLNEAYSNNQLEGYRALELKDSFNEQTTRMVQWGPQMRT